MPTDILGFKAADLRRIDEIWECIKNGDVSTLTADDFELWGDWQAARARDEAASRESAEQARAEIAQIKADNAARAADALNRLADLAEKAGR